MTLDFNLRHFQRTHTDAEARLHLLVLCRNNPSFLVEAGYEVSSVAGDVAAVFVPVRDLDDLQKHPEVVFVESTRAFKDETDVSAAHINLFDPLTDSRTIPGNGRGAIIGVIDSGFDLTHPCFSDSRDKSRIIAAWDQKNLDKVEGAPPSGFSYGIEYTREALNRHIGAEEIVVVKSRKGAGAHGTFVSGIAAGNGGQYGIYKGMAPEAELVLVTYRRGVPIGGSAYVLDAISYIQRVASACLRPVVINISQGDNLGAHDGTNLLERAIDNIVEQGRVLVVTSAGNERGGMACHHASGVLGQDRELALPFELMPSVGRPVDGDTIDLWYRHGDRFAVALESPGGHRSDFVRPGGAVASDVVAEFPGQNRASIYSTIDVPTNGDNRIAIVFEKGDHWEAGVWRLILRGEKVRRGDFDVWADRPNTVTLINFLSHQADHSTVTLPGNARRAITVGGFVSRPGGGGGAADIRGNIAPGSSIGPTRDGRIKPDLVAPSTLIMAPEMRVDTCPPYFSPKSGTSMAAPHVTGVIALLWALWPELTGAQISAALRATARSDGFTGTTPNTSCGYGKLDAAGAYKALSNLIEKGELAVADKRVFEFVVSSRTGSNGKSAPMIVRIEVADDETFVVTGNSNGEYYEGEIVLRKPLKEGDNLIGKENLKEGNLKEEEEPEPEGGDQCWINGVWYDPCPSGRPKPPK